MGSNFFIGSLILLFSLNAAGNSLEGVADYPQCAALEKCTEINTCVLRACQDRIYSNPTCNQINSMPPVEGIENTCSKELSECPIVANNAAMNSQCKSNESEDDPIPIDTSPEGLNEDLQAAEDSLNSANECCTNPEASGCGGEKLQKYYPPATADGIKAYCQQFKNASMIASNYNNEAASICLGKRKICLDKTDQAIQKWERIRAQSKGAKLMAIEEALPNFRSVKSACDDMKEVQIMLGKEGTQNFANSKKASVCEGRAEIKPGTDPSKTKEEKAEPASTPGDPSQTTADSSPNSNDQKKQEEQQQQGGGMGDAMQGLMNQQKQEDAKTASTSDNCSLYPNSPGCGGAADNFNDPSKVETSKGDAATLSDFNTGSIDGLPQQPQFGNYEAKASQGRAIPNGGGGFTGGGGGGSNFGDEGQANGGDGSRTNTDILNGMRGGGGASSPNVDPSAISGGGGFSGYGNSGGFRNRFKGLDLKQYLPGGKKDPNRKIASVKNPTGHADIAPVGESMFKMISSRMTLMCKMKRLIGCD